MNVPEPAESNELSRDDLWRTLHAVCEWIRLADAKAGACLAVDGVMLALFAARLRASPSPSLLATSVLFGAAALAALSALVAVWTVLPRAHRLGANSLVHYGTIASYKVVGEYQAAVLAAQSEPGVFDRHLTQHIWTMSRGATYKYRLVGRAIRLLAAAVVVGLVALLLR